MNLQSLQKKYALVFEELAKVPCGKVITYKALGEKAGVSPRMVGRIIHQNPDPKKYPCHRVVRSDGTLASGYAFGGKKAQKKKLEEEGIVFNKDKITL